MISDFLETNIKITTNEKNEELLKINNKLYIKFKGRAYRSYWRCVHNNCNSRIELSELKGGSIKLVVDHDTFCAQYGNKY